eukprot:scaffold13326_cov204-Alexandrium_tamarense.AAC.8
MCVARIVSFLVGHVCVPDCAACFVSRWCMGWERKENDDMHIVLYFSIARHLHGVKNRKLRGAFCLCCDGLVLDCVLTTSFLSLPLVPVRRHGLDSSATKRFLNSSWTALLYTSR